MSEPSTPTADAHPATPSAVATGRGDDGTTGLLFGGDRIPKDDPRTEAYGTHRRGGGGPRAGAGRARAEAQLDVLPPALDEIATLVLRIQRELFVAGAELAANPAAWDRLRDGATRVSAAMVAGVERLLADFEARIASPTEFVVPGETRTSAALELARTILRRAERRAVTLERAGLVPGPAPPALPQPPGRPPVGAGAGRGAGRGAAADGARARRGRARPAAAADRPDRGGNPIRRVRRTSSEQLPDWRLRPGLTGPTMTTSERRLRDRAGAPITRPCSTVRRPEPGRRSPRRPALPGVPHPGVHLDVPRPAASRRASASSISALPEATLGGLAACDPALIVQLVRGVALAFAHPADPGDRRAAAVLRVLGADRGDRRVRPDRLRARQRPGGRLVGRRRLRRGGRLRRGHEARPHGHRPPTCSWA